MATARLAAPTRPNPYLELLTRERMNAARWPRHDGRLLEQLEAGRPVVIWGYLAGTSSAVTRLHPNGEAEPLHHSDRDAVAFLKGEEA